MNKRDLKLIILLLMLTGIFAYQYQVSLDYSDSLITQLHADDPIRHYQTSIDVETHNLFWITTFPAMVITQQIKVEWYLDYIAQDSEITIKIDGIQYGEILNTHNGSLIISDFTGTYDVKILVNSAGIDIGDNGYVLDLYLW